MSSNPSDYEWFHLGNISKEGLQVEGSAEGIDRYWFPMRNGSNIIGNCAYLVSHMPAIITEGFELNILSQFLINISREGLQVEGRVEGIDGLWFPVEKIDECVMGVA